MINPVASEILPLFRGRALSGMVASGGYDGSSKLVKSDMLFGRAILRCQLLLRYSQVRSPEF
jgi:hypothetical protein